MAIHSRTIAWKVPWTEEPGRDPGRAPWGRKESDTTEGLHFHPRVQHSLPRLQLVQGESTPGSLGGREEKRGLDQCFLIYLHHWLAGPHCLRCRRGL